MGGGIRQIFSAFVVLALFGLSATPAQARPTAAVSAASASVQVTGTTTASRTVFVVADSVGLGARLELAARFPDHKLTVTGFPGLGVGASADLVEANPHMVGDIAVVAVGYNIKNWSRASFAAQIDRLVHALVAAGAKQIIWMGLREPTMATSTPARWTGVQLFLWEMIWPQFNELLRAALGRHPQLSVVDWDAVAVDASFVSDAIHLSDKGRGAFAQQIKRSVVQIPRRTGANQSVTVPIAGRGPVPANATAAWVRVTGVDPRLRARLFVHACDEPRGKSGAVASLGRLGGVSTLVPLDATGNVCVTTSHATHFTLDIQGWVRPNRVTTLESRELFVGAVTAGITTQIAPPSSNLDTTGVALALRARGVHGAGALRVHRCDAEPRTGAAFAFIADVAMTAIRIESAQHAICVTSGRSFHLHVGEVATTTAAGEFSTGVSTTVARERLTPTSAPVILRLADLAPEAPAGATVLLSVRTRAGASTGAVRIQACDDVRSRSHALGITPDQTETTLVPVPADATLCVHATAAATVVIDIVGTVPSRALTPVAPTEMWDTRRLGQRIPIG